MNTNENESEARRRYKRRGLHTEPKNTRQRFQNDISHRLIPSMEAKLKNRESADILRSLVLTVKVPME